jgi:hypothetical protein
VAIKEVREDDSEGRPDVSIAVVAEVVVVPVDEKDDVESLGVPIDGVEDVFSGIASGTASCTVGRTKSAGGITMVAAQEMIIRAAKSTGITSALISP